MNRSPGRHTFQLDCYLARCLRDGKNPDPAYVELYTNMQQQHQQIPDDAQKQNNMEYDLCSTAWICDKALASSTYAQNLYAAMCNREFQRQAVWPILRDARWSCSWRHAGGIVADMRQEGDYIDWYCSGIGNAKSGYGLSADQSEATDGYVPEGKVTDEIRDDLALLGWHVLDESDQDS